MISTPAPFLLTSTGLVRSFAMLYAFIVRLPLRDALIAALLALATSTVVYAEEKLQDWIPDALMIPEDAEVVTDRAIGSTVRLLSITTGADLDALFTDWEESLSSNGYAITQGEEDLLEQSIEFSGPGILNAKVIAAPNTHDGRHIIEFDATLK